MRWGFTGTQEGMSMFQHASVEDLLIDAKGEAHHGDCIGADKQFHKIAVKAGLYIIKHPPIDPSKQAHCKADEASPPKPYLAQS